MDEIPEKGELAEPAPVPPLQKGIYSSEFWLHVLSQIVAICVVIGLLSSDQSDAITKAIAAVVAAVASVFGATKYSANRTELKSLEK